MANRGGLGRSVAVVAVIVLFAAMLTVGAEAGRHYRHRDHHHHSPPAPPGYNEPMAAPLPDFGCEPSTSPSADSPEGFPFPETFAPSEGPGSAAAGPEGFQSARRLSESDSLADSPFAFGDSEGPAPQLPETGC